MKLIIQRYSTAFQVNTFNHKTDIFAKTVLYGKKIYYMIILYQKLKKIQFFKNNSTNFFSESPKLSY